MIEKPPSTMAEFEHEDSSSSTPYKELLILLSEKIWRDIRRHSPTTKLQRFSFALHIGLLIAVVGPRIRAWGHITRLNGLRYHVSTDLLPTILLIGMELITVSYCLALTLTTCKLYSQELQAAQNKNHLNHLALFRLVVYLSLIVILEGVMVAVVQFHHNGAAVVPVPYYICFWVSIAIFVIGSSFFLERKRPPIHI